VTDEVVYDVPGGEAEPGTPGELDAVMVDRLLQVVRPGPVFSSLISLFANRGKAIIAALEAVRNGFDVEDAVGIQLDRLGEILQLPRFGAGDERYRVLLQIQIQLILSSVGTTDSLLEVVRLFTGVDAPEYYEAHPLRFSISAIVLDHDDALLLRKLLKQAKVGGVAMSFVIWPDENVMLGDVLAPATPVDDPGLADVMAPDGPEPGAYVAAVMMET
jgi:hypothetical protein